MEEVDVKKQKKKVKEEIGDNMAKEKSKKKKKKKLSPLDFAETAIAATIGVQAVKLIGRV